MTLDYDGNFLYLAGGSSAKSSTLDKRSSLNGQSSGWIASVYLGGAERTQLHVTDIVSSPNPVQAITLQNNNLVSGGYQPGIKY